jgi:hypothetical protein
VTSLDNSGTPSIPHVVLASAYDAMNDRTQLTATVASTADFLNTYSFDAMQRLTEETQLGQTGGNGVSPKGVDFAYNLDSQLTSAIRFDPTTASPHPDIAVGTYSYGCDRLSARGWPFAHKDLSTLAWACWHAKRGLLR